MSSRRCSCPPTTRYELPSCGAFRICSRAARSSLAELVLRCRERLLIGECLCFHALPPPRVARHSYGQRTRLPRDDSPFTFLARSSFRIHTTTALPEKILTPGMHRGEAIAAPRSPLPAHRREFGVRRIAPPGSTARGEASEVPFGRKADLVTPGALKPRRGPSSGMRQSMSRKAELERSRRVAREGRDWTEPSKKGAYEEGPY
jgi:hypothetical protein